MQALEEKHFFKKTSSQMNFIFFESISEQHLCPKSGHNASNWYSFDVSSGPSKLLKWRLRLWLVKWKLIMALYCIYADNTSTGVSNKSLFLKKTTSKRKAPLYPSLNT